VTTPEVSGTGLFVYAVVRAERDLPDGLTGVDGSPVALVPYGDLGAVVGEVALDRPPGRRADLTAYAAVMEALVPGGAVAPLAFGTVMPGEQDVVEELLAPGEADLTRLLEQLDGRVQYNVQASYVEDAVLAEIVGEDPEIERLRDLTREAPEDARVGERIRLGELVARSWEQRARADADHLLTQLAPLVAAQTVRREPGPQAALDAAMLVDLPRTQEFEDMMEALAEAGDGRLVLRLVGPLAPYDFVGSA
jgi:hypothetical protein